MSELGKAEAPEPATLVEYQLVRMTGTVLLSMIAMFGQAVMWLPSPGMEIAGPCAGRYRITGGPWIVRAYYPDGFPGPQGDWPSDIELPGERPELPSRL